MYLLLVVSVFLIVSSTLGDVEVTRVSNPSIHGEGPHWDCDKQVLYYVDITNQTINKYDPKTNTIKQVYIDGGPVGLIVPDKFDGTQFVLARGLDLVAITWDGESSKPSSMKVLASVDQDKPQNRFNDGKVDSSGRLWAGTMGPENPDLVPNQGSLYSFDWSDQFKPVKHLSPVSVSNGIAWNDNDTLMYYIDSPTKVITVYDFDIVNGTLSNGRELFSLEKNNVTGVPDGMTIDEKGNLWVAVYRGGCVLNVDGSTGELLRKVEFPVSQVTSCAFGGEQHEDLYVTTSKVGLTQDDISREPFAGSLYKVTGLEVRGQIKPNTIRLF